MNYSFLNRLPVTVILLLLLFNAYGQTTIDINGKVINEKGDPMEGINVQIKGSDKGTRTNKNGRFTLQNASIDATLVFTAVHTERKEINAYGQSNWIITLQQKIVENKEVIVEASTGYQAIKPNEINGSVTVISNKMLNQQAGTNVLARLDGITSGLLFNIGKSNSNPQSTLNISVRGLSSINGPLDPLVVLDGFIYEGKVENINPNDIENITVLKDAAAASIWGARAGNGVIVLTSKKGQYNQRLKVSFLSGIILSQKPDLFSLPQISSVDYIDVEQFLFQKGYFNSQISSRQRPALTPAVEIFIQKRDGLITASDSAMQINALKQSDSRRQYSDFFYRHPVTQQYAINLSGGNADNAFLFSAGFDKSISELYNSYRKLNLRIENSYKPVKDLQISISANYTNSESNSGRLAAYNSIRVNNRQVPYLSFAANDGRSLPVASQYRQGYIDTAGGGQLLDWNYYPLEEYKHISQTDKLQELYAGLGIKYTLLKGLTVNLNLQFQQQQINGDQLQDVQSYAARNLINLFSQPDPSTGLLNTILPLGGIKTLSDASVASYTGRGQLNYNYSSSQHSLSAIAGAEIRRVKSKGGSNTLVGYNDDPLSYAVIDLVNSYPTFIDGSYQSLPFEPSIFNRENRFVSVYTNIAYTYKKRYSLSASARRDGSNIFGVTANDKWRPLWSAGAGWNIANEKFFGLSFLPVLKLRTTYGFNGNLDLSRSALPIARYFTSGTFNLPAARITTLNNPNLRWEKTAIINAGIDFAFTRDMLTGSVDFYFKKGTDLYGPTPYDYTGWGSIDIIVKNVANMKGKGIDIVLNNNKKIAQFRWLTSLLLNYNSNKTTAYFSEGSKRISTLTGAGGSISPVIGKPLYAIAAYRWGGLNAAGNPQGFVNGQLSTDYAAILDEGRVKGTEGNLIYVGPTSPTIFGSFINTISWRQFAVAVNVVYKFGYHFRKPTISFTQLVSSGAGHSDFAKRWQKPGDELLTNIPAFAYPFNYEREDFFALSQINVLKADHIRFQYINLNYTLSKANWNKSPFNELQVYLNLSNMGIIWRANREKLDPDYPGTLSPPKTLAFGIRASL